MVARTRSQSGALKPKVAATPPRDGHIQKSMRSRWLDDGVGEPIRATPRDEHPVGWTEHGHYLTLMYGRDVSPTAQCGDQSCPCCRAHVFRSGLDPGAIYGACPICLRA
jgi:hypothetical protein